MPVRMRTLLTVFSIIALLALLALGAWIVTKPPGEFPVPSVLGAIEDEGVATLAASGLVAEVIPEAGADSDVGRIVRQVPTAGSFVKTGRKIRVYIVSGTPDVEIPLIVGMNLVEAASFLRRVGSERGLEGLKVGKTSSVISDTLAGTVVEQIPGRGTIVKIGSTVDVVVAVENGADRMPNIVGLPLADAQQRLAAQSYMITQTEYLTMPQSPPGTVLSQKPAPGARLTQEASISIVVSAEPQPEWGAASGLTSTPSGTSYPTGLRPTNSDTRTTAPPGKQSESPTWKLGNDPIAADLE